MVRLVVFVNATSCGNSLPHLGVPKVKSEKKFTVAVLMIMTSVIKGIISWQEERTVYFSFNIFY